MSRPPLALLALGLTLAGCEKHTPDLPAACTARAADIVVALRTAPAAVELSDGTRLSTCVNRAGSDAELQSLGVVMIQAADRLAARAGSSDAAALQLGYLIGAARRGAKGTNGIHVELARRLEQTTGVDGAPPAHRAPFVRGLAAGTRAG